MTGASLAAAGLWLAVLAGLSALRPRGAAIGLACAVTGHVLLVSWLGGRLGLDPSGFTLWKEAMLAGVIAGTLLGPERRVPFPRADRLDLLALAFLAWLGLRTMLAVGAGELAAGVAARGLATDSSPVLLFLAARRLAWEPATRQRFAAGLVALYVACAAVGFVQLAAIGPGWYAAVGYTGPRAFTVPGFPMHRLAAVSLDPLVAGYLSAVGAGIAFHGLVRAPERSRSLAAWAVAALLLGAATALTFTRAAWLGLAVALVALVGLHRGPARRRLGIALGVGALAALPLAPALAHRAAAALALSDTSMPLHLERWALGARTLLEHPFGLGAGRAGEVSARLLGEARIVTESSYLQMGVEGGWPGLALFSAWVAATAAALWRVRAGAALAAWLVMAVAGLFQHAMTERAPMLAVALLAGMALARTGARE